METNDKAGIHLRWAYSAGRLCARLRLLSTENRRRVRVALSIALLVLVTCWLVGWSVGHFGQVRRRPNRASYEHLLVQTQAVLGPDGTVLIVDPNGAFLSLRIAYFRDVDHRPSLPFTYEFKFHYDEITISPQDDPSHSLSSADYGMKFSPGAELSLKAAPDTDLSRAINLLVTWSIEAAQSGAEVPYSLPSSDHSSNVYFLRCEPARGYYYLLLREHSSFSNLQSMQYAPALGYVIPVTIFHRAHLWRYLIDHYSEVRHLAENYLTAKRAETPKPDNS